MSMDSTGYGFVEDDNYYLERCPECKLENYTMAVASGQCAWCNFDGNAFSEKWLTIAGYEGLYEVSNMGRVKSLARDIANKGLFGSRSTCHNKELFLKGRPSSQGYLSVVLFKNAKTKQVRIHRLVAQLFLENPLNKPEVNHKDGDKNNCSLANLEWCTPAENSQHAFDTGLSKKFFGADNKSAKAVSMFTLEGKFIKTFSTRKEASEYAGVAVDTALRFSHRTAGGFRFKYACGADGRTPSQKAKQELAASLSQNDHEQ